MNKAITNIKYNHLNQPTEIDFGTKNTKYIYTATGVKLQTKIYEDGKLKSKTDYAGAYVYENDKLSYTNIQGGRIINNKSSINNYQYYLTDHLGNVRVTFGKDENGEAEIIQEDHYYPFGMRMSGQHYSNTELINKYLYNGKEQQEQTNYYDYGFRQMDAQLGRWHVIDAMSEKYFSTSPYAYVQNNPVSYKDLLGLKKYKSQQLKNNDKEWQMQKFYDNLQGSSMFGSAGSHTMSGAGIREASPTSADVDAFFAMGGGGEGSSVSDWYAAGGRAGMSLDDYVAANGGLSIPKSSFASVLSNLKRVKKKTKGSVSMGELVMDTWDGEINENYWEVDDGGNKEKLRKLFEKYRAGYIADKNAPDLYANKDFESSKDVALFLGEGIGLTFIGLVSNKATSGMSSLIVLMAHSKAKQIEIMKENYQKNGKGMGMYVFNVSSPGAFPKAIMFNASDESMIGWHHTTIAGAPMLQYHIYYKFIKELQALR